MLDEKMFHNSTWAPILNNRFSEKNIWQSNTRYFSKQYRQAEQ